MPTATVVKQFDMSADELWDLIGDFSDTSKWSGRPPEACRQEGDGIGCLRTLTLDDGSEIVDRLEDQGDYFYSYSIVTAPLPYKSYRATMSVTPIDDRSCKFTWSGDFEPKGMDDEKAVAFTTNVYHMGIGLMEATIAKRSG